MHRTLPPPRGFRLTTALRSAALAAAVGLASAALAVPIEGLPPAPPVPPVAGPPTPAAPALAPADVAATPAGPVNRLEPLKLDKEFRRESAGISVRVPAGFAAVAEAGREDEIVRFVDDVKKPEWTLVVSRRSFATEQHLEAKRDAKGQVVPGIVENTLTALVGRPRTGPDDPGVLGQFPGAKVLRAGDPTNIGKHRVGMIVIRYTKNGERRLSQHAIIEANDQLYYLLSFNTPARKDIAEDANPEERTIDPVELQAVDTFRNVIDGVKLLDLKPVRDDQAQRLIRTRSLFHNITEQKLAAMLVPERYLRIVRDGKDVGYSYVVEQMDRKANADGVSVGIRTRMMTGQPGERPGQVGVIPPFPREDSESWMFSTIRLTSGARRTEDWSTVTVWDDGKPKTPANPWRKVSEVGASQLEQKRVLAVDAKDPLKPENIHAKGELGDRNNPWVNIVERYTLNVQFRARADLEPVVRDLPPFYLPQAMGTMLPRLVPANEPKTYMFATYVSERQEVMSRYVDVGPEAELPPFLAGNGRTRGVPISDRIGFEGAPTVHWVTSKGEFIGSVTEATNTVVVPVEEAALKQMWRVNDVRIEMPKDLPKDVPADAPKANNPGANPPGRPAAAPGRPQGPGQQPAPGRLPNDLRPGQR